MNSANNKWVYVLLAILIIISSVNLWIINQSRNENGLRLQRDSVLQVKIDSITQAVNDFRTLYGNDRLISDNEKKITNNYLTYKNEKTQLLKNSADSVYNWTKRRLGLRSE